MLYKVKKFIKDQHLEYLLKHALNNKAFDPDQVMLIFSDPRGGSTWLTQLINEIEHTAVVWEPLHLGENSYFNKLNFGWRQHIPRDEKWEEASVAFTKLFSGKFLNAYATYLSGVEDFKAADQLIIKFCRGNALLPWLIEQFNFAYAPIYLIRHPFAVIASQLKQGSWNWNHSNFKVPDTPFNNIYKQHQDFLMSLNTKEESLVATWCITNKIPLDDENNNKKWITIHYEQLLLNPERELKRVFTRWNREMPIHILEKVRQPSMTTVADSQVEDKIAQLSKWKKHLSATTISNLEKVLDYFEIRDYNKDILPLTSYE